LSKKEKTTIEISKETREQLKELGKKGETYDSIIRRLIESKKGKKANL
jgi:predicted CopG family antitoxin